MLADQNRLASRFRRLLNVTWQTAESPLQPVKIWGERNSGTNLAAALISANSSHVLLPGKYAELVRLNPRLPPPTQLKRLPRSLRENIIDLAFRTSPASHGWKHSSPAYLGDERLPPLITLFLVRNPLSWLVSLHKNPYHLGPRVPMSFSSFLATRFNTLGRERLNKVALTPPEIWLRKLEAYVSICERLSTSRSLPRLSLFENLVTCQVTELKSWKLWLSDPAQVREIVKSQKGSQFSSSDYANYYANELWRRDLSEDETLEASRLFSPDLLAIWSRA